MKKVVIAGGSGFLGLNLAKYLNPKNYQVTILSRQSPRNENGLKFVQWDGCSLGEWVDELNQSDVLINLSGRSVDCIKNAENCDEILRSRVESTLALGKAIRKVTAPPSVWIQMSTAHIYGDSSHRWCDEDSVKGYGLAPTVAQRWEEAFHESILEGMRPVILRTSFVLGRYGGALKRLTQLARVGLGGTVGSGQQGLSWIHEDDMNRIFLEAIENETMKGVYIATVPNPVSNQEFMFQLRKAVGMPIGLPAFEWMVRLVAPIILKTDPELALYGRYCIPKKLMNEGFEFKYPIIDEAFRNIFSS